MNAYDFYTNTWIRLEHLVSRMETTGVAFDPSVCTEALALIAPERERLQGLIDTWAGHPLNVQSPKQVLVTLFIEKGLDLPPIAGSIKAVKRRDPDTATSDEMAVSYLADRGDQAQKDALRALLQLRKLRKLQGYYESLPRFVAEDGRIHASMGPEAASGRLRVSRPGLQAISKAQANPLVTLNPVVVKATEMLRRAVVAPSGKVLVRYDFSGLEWRILAHYLADRFGDWSLTAEVQADIDPHSSTAQGLGNAGVAAFEPCTSVSVHEVKDRFKPLREMAKTVNYSINYGKTGRGLGVACRDDKGEPMGAAFGKQLLAGFYAARPGVKKWHEQILFQARRDGYVRSLLGRYRYLPYDTSPERMHRDLDRKAMNVIQNSAADVVTLAMLKADAVARPLGAELVLQCHDELIFECDEGRADVVSARVAEAMTSCCELSCPLGVEGGVGRNWVEAG